MSAAKNIREYINNIPAGKPFPAASLRHLALAGNIRQILNRMVRNKELKRVANGIFVKPETNKYIGEVTPDAKAIVQTIAQKTGEKIAMHGAEAARLLHLTTQMPTQPIFYTTGTTREVNAGNITILLKHITPNKLVDVESIAGIVILALWYLGKSNVETSTINKIQKQLNKKQFEEVIAAMARMPVWMANLFYQHLKETINNE